MSRSHGPGARIRDAWPPSCASIANPLAVETLSLPSWRALRARSTNGEAYLASQELSQFRCLHRFFKGWLTASPCPLGLASREVYLLLFEGINSISARIHIQLQHLLEFFRVLLGIVVKHVYSGE